MGKKWGKKSSSPEAQVKPGLAAGLGLLLSTARLHQRAGAGEEVLHTLTLYLQHCSTAGWVPARTARSWWPSRPRQRTGPASPSLHSLQLVCRALGGTAAGRAAGTAGLGPASSPDCRRSAAGHTGSGRSLRQSHRRGLPTQGSTTTTTGRLMFLTCLLLFICVL